MAIYDADNNGNAPSTAQIGDTIRTLAGNYTIVAPNTDGATYNPKSGFWSVKRDDSNFANSALDVVQLNNKNYMDAANAANAISQMSSAAQYKYNSDEAEKNRLYQTAMSNTAHQREVQDLIAAGLNPVLSANLGGASTPAGATASGGSFTGQKAEVDTQYLGAMVSLYETIMNNNASKDIARINAESALQTAKISSAASMYAANMHNTTANPLNRVLNQVIASQSDRIDYATDKVFDFLWNNAGDIVTSANYKRR